MTQRVMDAADADEVMLSEQYAAWLAQFDGWNDRIVEAQEIAAKHGPRRTVLRLLGTRFHRT